MQLQEQLDEYHRFLAVNVARRRGKEFWDYHRGRLEESGYPIKRSRMLKMAAKTMLREILNPEQAIRKTWKRLSAS